MIARRRILFVAENITLAQVVRLVTLARSLDATRYQVHFACSQFNPLIFHGTAFERWPIQTIPRYLVDRALSAGRRIYDKPTLRGYVRAELELLERVRPHLVVGDFRLSLAVSAPLSRVPYANLINAYWSPHAERASFPLPDHPMVSLLGEEVAGRYFSKAMPWVFDHFARPVNELRQEHGLLPLGSLPEVLTAGDYTLFPDIPSLVPTAGLPPHQLYLGPVLWSPPLATPKWWSSLDDSHPVSHRGLRVRFHRNVELYGLSVFLLVLVALLEELPVSIQVLDRHYPNVFVLVIAEADLEASLAHVVRDLAMGDLTSLAHQIECVANVESNLFVAGCVVDTVFSNEL